MSFHFPYLRKVLDKLRLFGLTLLFDMILDDLSIALD
jgi:hypothetical protein